MLTERFSRALQLAERLHRTQTRKGTDVPYLAHLLAVAARVLEWGGDEDVAIAALLHDAVEDQGGPATAALIREAFGERVARLVLCCTDSVIEPGAVKAPWLERKTAYLARLPSMEADAALIVMADKLHNLQATLRDLRRSGPETLQRFEEPDRLLWYYGSVVEALRTREDPHPGLEELDEAVFAFEAQLTACGRTGGAHVDPH